MRSLIHCISSLQAVCVCPSNHHSNMAERRRSRLLKMKSRIVHFRSSSAFMTFVVAYAVFTEQFLFAVIVPVAPFSLAQRAHIPDSGTQYWVAWLFATYCIASVVSSREPTSTILPATMVSMLTDL